MGKKILVISKGYVHPSLLCRSALKQLLMKMDDSYSFTFVASLQGINKLHLDGFDGVILYYHEKKLSHDQWSSLREFSSQGGGILAIHSAMASFKENEQYQKLLGGKFTGHDEIREINIRVKDKKDNPFNPLKDVLSFTLRDELYLHEYDQDNQILLVSEQNGREEPVLWTKVHDIGRLCYFSLGHCSSTFRNNTVQGIIHRSIKWITGQTEEI